MFETTIFVAAGGEATFSVTLGVVVNSVAVAGRRWPGCFERPSLLVGWTIASTATLSGAAMPVQVEVATARDE